MNSGSCGGKLLSLDCESISVPVVGLRKFFWHFYQQGIVDCFFTDFGFIKLLRVFSIMKGDNFVIGVSSVDSSTINLGKRVWSESLSESDSACRCFGLGFFSFGFWLCLVPIEPYEGRDVLRGKPICLGKSRLHIQYTHTKVKDQQFGIWVFIPKFITHLEIKGETQVFLQHDWPCSHRFLHQIPTKVFCRPPKEGLT